MSVYPLIYYICNIEHLSRNVFTYIIFSNSNGNVDMVKCFFTTFSQPQSARPKHAYGIAQFYLPPACFLPKVKIWALLLSSFLQQSPAIYTRCSLFCLPQWERKAELTPPAPGVKCRLSCMIGCNLDHFSPTDSIFKKVLSYDFSDV